MKAEYKTAESRDRGAGDAVDHLDRPEEEGSSHGDDQETAESGQNGATANGKDPSRPRRKKARRACFACQRAHLTCGDERPCQRCIKRGLQDACHDGVRKKAKYLHDAPDGALNPGFSGGFYNKNQNTTNHLRNALPNNAALSRTSANIGDAPTQRSPGTDFYSTPQPGSYNVFQGGNLSQTTFPSQSPVSPTFNMKTTTTETNGLPSIASSQPPNGGVSRGADQSQNPFAGPFFDPSDPALFNFDLSSMNFENRYGALEFGMLGHMATGAGESPSDSTQRGSVGRSSSAQYSGTTGLGESPRSQQPFMFGDPLLNEWPSGTPPGQAHVNVGGSGVYSRAGQNSLISPHMSAADAPHAFAIESNPAHFTSPDSATSPQLAARPFGENAFNHAPPKADVAFPTNGPRPVISTPNLKHQILQVGSKRRHRDPSTIYQSVKEPYPYTSGFHNLTALIQRRFSPQKTLQIAKALASIRPSFIATTKTLNRDDLVFMEKCFQRTLWEYEDFINACGTPTIVCRRTGEVAAVGKEFSILTGWKKEVLLGKEPNLNVNRGGSASQSGTTSRGSFTPRSSNFESVSSGSGRPQPVFLAELLDDDSVVEFYEDFARLAFGDSRGSVMTTCKLLKYKTKEDMEAAHSEDHYKWSSHIRKGGIAGEAGMNRLGFKDGRVECAYCWTVKRDVFDIPMLIVMNFLPCI